MTQSRPTTVAQWNALAVTLEQQGRFADLANACLQSLRLDERQPETFLRLGNALINTGNVPDAMSAYQKALALRPEFPEALSNLGFALRNIGKSTEAIPLLRRALALRPDYIDAMTNLGLCLTESGELDEAARLLRRVSETQSDSFQALINLGCVYQKMERLDDAIESYRLASQIATTPATNPYMFDVWWNLANLQFRRGRMHEAIASYQQVLALRPDFVEALNNLGFALRNIGKASEAMPLLRQALSLNSDHIAAMINLGLCLSEGGELDEGERLFHRVLEIQPDSISALADLGYVYQHMGLLDQAIECYGRITEIAPTHPMAHNFPYLIHFHPAYDPRQILDVQKAWYSRNKMAQAGPPFNRDQRCAPHRLRIGYVSPDFCRHPVGRFILPLIEHHDHQHFEIFCYSDVGIQDELTAQLKAGADQWRQTGQLADAQLAELIAHDHIDVLVDLTMHMKGSRLGVFTRKPAPIQVTYLAYCSTTGVDTMDYRFSDPYLDPPEDLQFAICDLQWGTRTGEFQSQIANCKSQIYSEQTWRLPRTYWCYREPRESPSVGPLPARSNGYVTFGCLNTYMKMTGTIFEIWCRLLAQVPDSRLIMHSQHGRHRQLAREQMWQRGIDPSRLQFVAYQPLSQYLEQYNQIDIALDPFPYGGGTTTLDALWMGVPVVSRRGQTCVSRGGLSILSNLGCAQWVASSDEEYVKIAAELANDLTKLEAIRTSLRRQLQASPLMDATQFARDVESAYQQMWQTWCEQSTGASS